MPVSLNNTANILGGLTVPTTAGPVQGVALLDAAGNQIVSFGQAAATGGATSYSAISANAVLTTAVKASAGQVYGVHMFNNTGSIVYGRLYDMATAPGSSDTASVIYRFLVPANTSGAGFIVSLGAVGRACATGIGIRVSTGIADNDTGALTANTILANVIYK